MAVLASSVLALLPMVGCTLCAPGFIDDYATVGGKWQRDDPTQGRVGSPFSDAGSSMGAVAVEQPNGSSEAWGETIYEDGNSMNGMEFDNRGSDNQGFDNQGFDNQGFDKQGIEIYGDETYYESSFEEEPYYNDAGEGW